MIEPIVLPKQLLLLDFIVYTHGQAKISSCWPLFCEHTAWFAIHSPDFHKQK